MIDGVAARVAAHGARILRVEIAADAADGDLLHRALQRCRQRGHQQIALLDQMQRRAARGARPEPRQAREQLDQPLDLRSGNGRGHAMALSQRF